MYGKKSFKKKGFSYGRGRSSRRSGHRVHRIKNYVSSRGGVRL